MICDKCSCEMKHYLGLKQEDWYCDNQNCGKQAVAQDGSAVPPDGFTFSGTGTFKPDRMTISVGGKILGQAQAADADVVNTIDHNNGGIIKMDGPLGGKIFLRPGEAYWVSVPSGHGASAYCVLNITSQGPLDISAEQVSVHFNQVNKLLSYEHAITSSFGYQASRVTFNISERYDGRICIRNSGLRNTVVQYGTEVSYRWNHSDQWYQT